MHRKYLPASFVCLAALFTCKTLLAASCLVDPDPKVPAQIKPDGKTLEQLSSSKPFSDCSKLVLVSGVINVLYETPDGLKRLTCEKADKLCSVNAGTWPSWLEPFKPKARAGGKKMDEEVSRLPGIPYGKVFSVEKATTFNLGKAGFNHWNLTLTEANGKKPIYSKSGSDPTVQVPSSLLRPGGKYTLLIDGNKKYKGGFDILGGTEAEDIAKEIKRVGTDTSATARTRKLDELIILYENNLDYEVELLREELKL
jgi:hypothetical protein